MDVNVAFESEYLRWKRVYDAHNWIEAIRLGAELKESWAQRTGLSFDERRQLATVMLGACEASRYESSKRTGHASPRDFEALAELRSWVQQQPERRFRGIEGAVLYERMRWCAGRVEALDALEEFVELLVEFDNAKFRKAMATLIVERIHPLFYAPPEDRVRYEDALEEAVDTNAGSTLDPEEIGVSEATVSRMERLAKAFETIADCLDLDDDADALKLRATMLVAALSAVGRLGQTEKAESLFERLAAQGESAIAGWNTLIEQTYKSGSASGDPGVALSVASAMMGKVGLLARNGETDAALAVATEVIDCFAARPEPVIAAIVRQARDIRTYLLGSSQLPEFSE